MLALVAGQGLAAELDRTPVEVTTVDGQKVRLFPNGRWEFADAAKAAQAQKIAAEYPENRTRPVEAQGGGCLASGVRSCPATRITTAVR